jgi:CRISPR-associated protein Cas6
VTGERVGPGQLGLTPRSRLRVRVADAALRGAVGLAGKLLRVGDSAVRLGPPTVVPLVPAAVLRARVVTFKNCDAPDRFLATARDKLEAAGVSGEPLIPLVESGPRAGEPQRRVVRVKGKAVVGYSLIVSGLTAEESVRLQEHGLGGRTRMGCGFFLPVRG